MAEIGKNKNRKEEKFKIVVLNDQTYEEKFAFKIKRKFVIPGVVLVFILMLAISLLIISYTPLKLFIRGYANIENNTYVIRMNKYVEDLEKQVASQDKYIEAIQHIMRGVEESPAGATGKEKSNPKGNKKEGSYKATSSDLSNVSSFRKKIGVQYLNAPLDGQIIHPADFKKGHYGIDIAGKKNSAVKAIMEGVVIFADYSIETGYTIALQHPNDMVSVYKHNDKLLKKIGTFVAASEAIGIIGNTGLLTDGPHLHFELWYKSTPLNPADYIVF
jgi:murein DD-endopeptidase MepM/ murein hydrolase activator NlpD